MEKHDRLEHVEHEIYCVQEAIDLLSEVDEADGVIEVLDEDILPRLRLEKERLHAEIEEDDAEDRRALARGYYKSIL